MDLTTAAILCFIPIFILSFVFIASKPKHKNLPPNPPAWPILGNLPTLFTHSNEPFHITLTKMAPTYGPLFGLKLGQKRVVVASTTEAAMEILKTHDRALSGREIPLGFRLEHHIKYSVVWADCTDNWKNLRKLLRTEIFAPKMLQAQENFREQKVRDMMNFIRGKQGNVVNVRQWVFGCLLNILGSAVFSKDVFVYSDDGDKIGMQTLLRDMLIVGTTPNVGEYFPFLEPFDLQGLRQQCSRLFARGIKLWDGTVKERRLCRNEESIDMLDVLLANDFNNDQINALFLETFGPGSETSSATIEWALSELIRNPDKMVKLREELDRIVGQSIVKESHLPYLPYLQACVKETMRLYPAAPFLLPHKAVETCQVMGYTIPKGYTIFVNVYAIGRDPKIWKEPLKFMPERFLECDMEYNGTNFQFIPFGAGRRICVGWPLAARTIPLILSSLVHGFNWELPDGMHHENLEMKEMLCLSLNKDPPLLAIPKTKA